MLKIIKQNDYRGSEILKMEQVTNFIQKYIVDYSTAYIAVLLAILFLIFGYIIFKNND
jgi:hypothetical protein